MEALALCDVTGERRGGWVSLLFCFVCLGLCVGASVGATHTLCSISLQTRLDTRDRRRGGEGREATAAASSSSLSLLDTRRDASPTPTHLSDRWHSEDAKLTRRRARSSFVRSFVRGGTYGELWESSDGKSHGCLVVVSRKLQSSFVLRRLVDAITEGSGFSSPGLKKLWPINGAEDAKSARDKGFLSEWRSL